MTRKPSNQNNPSATRNQHGTDTCYTYYACRCDRCKLAHRDNQRRYRAEKQKKKP